MTEDYQPTQSQRGGYEPPRSLAIIMDGNGRWARGRGFARIKGHEQGVRAVRDTVTECAQLGLEALTLYAFSEENWKRPNHEVRFLMGMLKRFLVEERPTLMDNRVRLVHCGRIERLPDDVRATLFETESMTAENGGMVLNLALSYGGRQEIVDAARQLACEVKDGTLDLDDIDERRFAARLYRPDLPDPDLVIRTAGELRISNFLLWQISYAEIYVTDVCWPEFQTKHLHEAFAAYRQRERRFGGLPSRGPDGSVSEDSVSEDSVSEDSVPAPIHEPRA